jgi:hypothetical protein
VGNFPPSKKPTRRNGSVLTADDTVLAQHGTICLCLQHNDSAKLKNRLYRPLKTNQSTSTLLSTQAGMVNQELYELASLLDLMTVFNSKR